MTTLSHKDLQTVTRSDLPADFHAFYWFCVA